VIGAAAGIRFLRFSGRRVAYELTGEGPPLVLPAWWVSHLELDWRDPEYRSFWESLARGYTLARYDRLGVGMSDREVGPDDVSLERDVAVLEALLDELGWERAVLVGGSSGGCAAVAFAARYPERVERLLLYGAYAAGGSIAPVDVRAAVLDAVRSHWGLGSRLLADIFLADAGTAEHERFARFQRAATSAEIAAMLLESTYSNDVRTELAQVQVPTLVLHRRSDRAIPYRLGRELAAAIPRAALIPLLGKAHLPWAGDSDSVVRAARSALDREPTPAAEPEEPAGALLSGREREVLTLVARGLSDREIAEQLVVSPHTVHRHVANIRNKLGRGSRTAAVAEAARLGLL
jgi:pimeloyl-ACP methyl ester carboxylesterase/DNA-binding CsgD family transcriptional regulator